MPFSGPVAASLTLALISSYVAAFPNLEKDMMLANNAPLSLVN